MSIFLVVGRLGRDAEVRYTPNGTAVANLALAYSFGQKDPHGSRPTQWVECALWGEQAVKLNDYLLKGTVLNVTLRDAHVETFTRQDRSSGHKLIGTVIHLEFVPAQKPKETASAAAKPSASPAKNGNAQAADDIPFDDDIPF